MVKYAEERFYIKRKLITSVTNLSLKDFLNFKAQCLYEKHSHAHTFQVLNFLNV